jgi:hypothetical protein
VKHLEHHVLVGEILPFTAVLDPVMGEGLLGVRYFATREVGEPVVDPFLEVSEVLSNLHIVLVDDFLGRIAIGKNGIEAFADLPDPVGDRIAFDSEMEVPIQIEIALEIWPHQRLAGVTVGQKLVKKSRDLVAIHRPVQVRR